MNWTDKLIHFAISDVGLRRTHNQDAYCVVPAKTRDIWERRGHLFMVADGMGAHAVGEMASKLAVDSIGHLYSKLADEDPVMGLAQAIHAANQAIHQKGKQNREFEGMGTTATALVLLPRGACVGHVGDSRCYRIRDAGIEQLSFDHSLQWEMARRQRVRPEELIGIPSNIIVRSLGPESSVNVELNGPYPIQLGDRFILCSDGLSGLVNDWEIWSAVRFLPAEEACRFLVSLANLRGGFDNITVIYVGVGETTAERPVRRRWRWPIRSWRWPKSIPWPWWLIAAGLACELSGVALQLARLPGDFSAQLLSLGLWVGGLVGLVLRRRQLAIQSAKTTAPIYRSQPCSLDRQSLDEFAAVAKQLHELARAENWDLGWDDLRLRTEAAIQHLAADDRQSAYRELARTLSILADGMPQRQQKSEVLKPHWRSE